jgi:hypothetical protein
MPHSNLITWGWYNRPMYQEDSVSPHPMKLKIKTLKISVYPSIHKIYLELARITFLDSSYPSTYHHGSEIYYTQPLCTKTRNVIGGVEFTL